MTQTDKDNNKTKTEEKDYKFKVGIPRALYYYKYFPIWEELLTRLGCKIILSPETNTQIVEEGAAFASSELCVPMKVYFGHVMYLLEHNPDLDYIFVPRYISLNKSHYFCPKFMALPDTVKHTIKPKIPILEWDINAKRRENIESAILLGKELGASKKEAAEAYIHALQKFKEYKNYFRKGMLFDEIMYKMYPQYHRPPTVPKKKDGDAELDNEFPITIFVIGHPYNTFESIINLDLMNRLKKYHVNVVTLESLPDEVYKGRVTIQGEFNNYWNMEEELLQAARYFLLEAPDEIDGVLFLISFACGPDSLIEELIMRDFKKINKPFLDLILDEHSGESGMVTRIESFIDMIRRKKFMQILRQKKAS
ncbi:MAG: acyl-CoA dehydratase activase-related protein [Promethearchaeota archaeon]